MEDLLPLISVVVAIIGVIATIIGVTSQLRRTPKRKAEPETITPTCLTVIGVPMNYERDRLGL